MQKILILLYIINSLKTLLLIASIFHEISASAIGDQMISPGAKPDTFGAGEMHADAELA